METDKTRRLILALEGIAILTALVLILVDYKLKNDLVDLYKKMEVALENGRKLMGPEFATDIDTSRLRAGPMVDNAPTLETPDYPSPNFPVEPNGEGPGPTAKRSPAKRSGRNGNQAVPESDKPVGT